MKLAVFTGQYFWFDGKDYSTDEAFVKFVSSFYPYFEKVVFCDSTKRERRTEAYVLDPTKTEVCPLPYFSLYSFWKNILVIYPKIYRLIKDNIQDWDIVWVPAPHPVSLLFAYSCSRQRKPFLQMVRANLIEQVRHSNRGVKRYCGMAVVAILEHVSRWLARKHLTFTVGREMYNAYKRRGGPVHEIAVSLVSERDIEDTLRTKGFEPRKPVRLLSIGRLDPEKGLFFLIEAVDDLVNKKRLDVVLQIAGKGLKGKEEKRLRQKVEEHQLMSYVRFLGYVSHGRELFQLYRESDIFILPSLTGEGVPQTLFEAMASGIPIIATKVAGIPQLVKDGENGLLINQGSSSEICEAVERIDRDAELRKRLVTNGLATVRNHTLEAERDRMIIQIQRLLDSEENSAAYAG